MINSIPDEWNCQFLILGSESDLFTGLEIVEKTDHKAVNLCGSFNLRELINLMSRLSAVISGDTGPMHIAAALNLKQIAIFGSTHPKLGFSPQNDKAIVVKTDIKCQPCSLHGFSKCPKKHLRCLKEIDPQKIKSILHDILF
jgi:heptosyltransferase-2